MPSIYDYDDTSDLDCVPCAWYFFAILILGMAALSIGLCQ